MKWMHSERWVVGWGVFFPGLHADTRIHRFFYFSALLSICLYVHACLCAFPPGRRYMRAARFQLLDWVNYQLRLAAKSEDWSTDASAEIASTKPQPSSLAAILSSGAAVGLALSAKDQAKAKAARGLPSSATATVRDLSKGFMVRI